MSGVRNTGYDDGQSLSLLLRVSLCVSLALSYIHPHAVLAEPTHSFWNPIFLRSVFLNLGHMPEPNGEVKNLMPGFPAQRGALRCVLGIGEGGESPLGGISMQPKLRTSGPSLLGETRHG